MENGYIWMEFINDVVVLYIGELNSSVDKHLDNFKIKIELIYIIESEKT